MVEQLALDVVFREDATFENFLGNAFIVSNLKQVVRNQNEQFVYLYGDQQSGKTHLLQAMCHFARSLSVSAFYLPLKHIEEYSPQIFDGLEQYDLIVLGDLEVICGLARWEEALFHLYNRVKDANARLVIAANESPKVIEIALPDLSSRLNWGLSLKIENLSDEEKIDLLQARADDRGLVVSPEVANYLITHYSRNLPDLIAAFDELDKASMQQQRKITIPFVKQILNKEKN